MAEKRSVWFKVGIAAAIVFVVSVIVVEVVVRQAAPILQGRIVETLSTHFKSRVELTNLRVSVLRGLEVSGDGLKIYPPDSVMAAGAKDPLIALEHFSFHSGIIGLFFKPMHVGTVAVTGLEIKIPPAEMRRQAGASDDRKSGKIKIVVDEIVCDNSRLIIGTSKPDKDPKDFELKHIALQNVGPNSPWKYQATLTNCSAMGRDPFHGHVWAMADGEPGRFLGHWALHVRAR